ncbi:hypothetical protein [Streptomyces sp. NPDC049906]|uniref:hypothetical protein n=1 Tax=Streptomyces sp. NPDC049906 TaxID=3155656 RepID=UPI0034227E0B
MHDALPPPDPGDRPPPSTRRHDYQAFRTLARPVYLRYAEARLGREAVAVAEEALTSIAVRWTALLSSPNTFASAWQVLRHTVTGEAARRQCTDSPLYQLLPPAHADAVLLSRDLRMTPSKIAQITGTSPSAVRALIAHAERSRLPY